MILTHAATGRTPASIRAFVVATATAVARSSAHASNLSPLALAHGRKTPATFTASFVAGLGCLSWHVFLLG